MLLQIVEPKAKTVEEGRVQGVGIDLGTTHSVASYMQNGQVHTLKVSPCGGGLLPSVVAYPPDQRAVVGEDAKKLLKTHPNWVVSSVKRLMGRDLNDEVAAQFPHALKDTSNGLCLSLTDRDLTPTEVSADILRELESRLEATLGYPVSRAVITVPAYFDEAAREATRNAAQLAGFDVLRLLNEPTAAALAYGLDEHSEGIYGVYDLGGGTFDFSVLKMEKGVFRVLATGGDLALGGDDIDQALAVYALGHHFQKLTPEQQKQVLDQTKQAKELLSEGAEVILDLSEILGEPKRVPLSAHILDELAEPFINRTLYWVQRVLKDANVDVDQLKAVVCVGGSTRLAQVQQALKDFLGKPALTTLDPDYAVAMGAAKQAHALTQGDSHLLLDITPLSLGVETMGGVVERLIPRNAPIPTHASQTFTTYQDGQSAMKIHVVQGEREMVKDCRSLAHFELRGIPPMPAGVAKILITFSLDADGLLTVKAQEQTTHVTQEVVVKPSYGLSPERMQQLLEESQKFASEDLLKRLEEQKKLEARQSLREVQKLLKHPPSFLSPENEAFLEEACQQLATSIEGDSRPELSKQLELFTQKCLPFIERALQEALCNSLETS